MLRQIYVDVSNGTLSRQDALEKIKAIKLQQRNAGVLLTTPVWQAGDLTAGAEIEYAEHHVIPLPAGDEENLARRYQQCALECFARIQAILKGKPQGKVLVQIVATDPLFAGLSGLLKTAALENPQFSGQMILVPPHMTADERERCLWEEKSRGLDPLVTYEHGLRQVLRWQEVADEQDEPPVAFKDDGVYLITGGLGALGRLFTREIADGTGRARIVLTGRSEWNAGKQARLNGLSRASYRQVDLGDLDQVEQLIASIKEEHGRLDGILHCAGMIADNFILKKSSAEFTEVLTPKVAGTFHLDRASRDVELDFFVMFSSFAGAMGNLGQADYATANGFMDQFAWHRNRQVAGGRRHGRTRSIDWTLWQDGGMEIDRASFEVLQRATGVQPLQTATGMRAFHRSLALPYAQILVGEGDLAQMRSALLAASAVSSEPEAKPAAPRARIDSEGLAEKTQDFLRRQFSSLLKLPAHVIDGQAALEQYGIDSILAMKLTSELEQTFGRLPKTLFFEYQTIAALSEYFVQSHSARLAALFQASAVEARPETQPPARTERASSRRPGRARRAVPAPATESDPIAIIGLSGRYPEAIDLEAYWQNLRDGKDCIVEVPKERWNWREYFSDDRTQSGHHYSKWGGFIAGVDEFDPLFFNISPKEAKLIDPQERLFLQHAWMAVEDAGYTRAGLQAPCEDDLEGQVGVYAGLMYSEYQLFGAEAGARGKRLGIAGSAASIANRVSYVLNLHGPSMTLDTMCSSSLTAIHLACQDLKQRRTSLAIAGGVNVSIHPNKYLVLSTGQFISSDGHCQSFGEGGDGYIPGEGVGVAVLKRLSEAERDGDHIYGIIRGSALNHGGKTNGYTVPNPRAQAGAIGRALADARIDARHISYIEAHGTGTKLGDPIEIAALSNAFARSTKDTQFCLIGSVKSNIGHCESAAGIAALTKVLLQMQHRQIVPSLHSAQLNPHIDFESSPFVVNQSLRSWDQPVIDGRTLPRIAGISSFGAGGSNAHLIVEEYQAPAREPMAAEQVIVPLSARTAEQLQRKAGDLLEFVRPRLNSIDLLSMAYTLQAGREAMEERLAFVVSSAEQLVEKLQAHVAGQQTVEEAYRGEAKRNKEALAMFSTDADLRQTVDKWIVDKRLSKLADLWVKGLEVDWTKLYGDNPPHRITLPTYPFARERHWIDIAAAPPAANATATAVLHPLLHTNTSELGQQSYSSTFSGEEFFLSGGILPAAAQLEMARAAVENAARPSAGTLLEWRDVVWAQPIHVTQPTPVRIALWARDDEQIDYEISTRDGEEEIVHCEGRVILVRRPPPAALDLEQLERQGQRLVPLRMPADAAGNAADYVLHPVLIDSALRAAGESRLPVGLDSLLVLSPCTPEMVAWVRSAADIDLCDARGKIAAQMRGVSWQQASPEVVEPVQPELALVRREIVFAPSSPTKRTAVSLVASGRGVLSGKSATRARITLASARQDGATAAASGVRLYDRGHGVYAIEIAEPQPNDVIASLCRTLERVQQEASLRVLILSGVERALVGGGREAYNAAVEQRLYHAIVSFPYPVIAVLHGDAAGAPFLAAALCDFMVCSEDASYGYTDVQRRFYPTAPEASLFSERFGAVQAQDFLYRSTLSTGRQLRRRGWTCPILPPAQIDAYVENLALTLADKSQDALRLLKQHLTRRLAACVSALTRIETPATEEASGAVAVIRYGKGGLKDPLPDRAKAIVLVAEDPDIPDDVASDLQRFVVESEVPVVAALIGSARDNAWLVSQFCDACVYSKTGVYSAAKISFPGAALFAHRLGNDAGEEVLLTGADERGIDLKKRVGTLIVTEDDRVLSAAMELAESWAQWPRAALASWKQHSASTIRSLLSASEPADEISAAPPSAPVSIPLQSRVVTATAHPEGIVVVKIEDREARNMFSDAFIDGVTEAFAHIEQEPAYKVVVLTGYDTYFAAGGTKESLLAVQEGKAKFTDVKVVQLPLDCKLPVIAAMQGHGIGAGWTMGMFADLVLMSEESRYVSPYMSYGFTPGAGATWILADKIGPDLARESLFTGRSYTGTELKERGLRLPIVPRSEVVPAAMALARRIAQVPRGRLISLKRRWTQSMREAVEETYRLELEMHEKTFVGRPDTLARIRMNFRSEAGPRIAVAPMAVHVPAPAALPAVMATLRTLLANELQMREADIDDNAQFVDLGLDSISGVTWVRKINETYRTSIEPTKVYSYPTLTELGRHVREEAEKEGVLSSPVAAPAVDPPVPHEIAATAAAGKLTSRRSRAASRIVASAPAPRLSQPIAVVGMAGQFPQARNLDEFWQNLAEGRNCITEVPRERWDVNAYYQAGDPAPGKTNSQWLGALAEYDRFDPLFFNISPTEAEFMDPQQRLFLQACWHGIENAGYDARSLSGSKCGVFVGCAAGDYQQLSRRHQLSAQGFTGNAASILAARISYFLNLQGPCISIDTACSSSLVAVAQACDSLSSGGSDLALAGGVYVMAGPDMHIGSSQTGMLSPQGRCFTFDQRADGFVPGEGVGVVMLKRLADAEKDGDIICGVIQGWGVNQDGRTNGITAPNPESQTRLEQDVYDKYEIDPANIRLIEAHGTGTKLGDPIELEGLKNAFAKYTRNTEYCALGSVKSNIGHCLTAAGIAGVIKLLLALKHKQLPPTINFERLNEHIDLTESPFYVNTRLQEWELDGAATRQAAVSSFGFSGTNAHIVIGEHLTPAGVRSPVTVVTQDTKMIVLLSARKPKQLEQKARDLLDFVRREASSTNLIEIAYTLQVGREAMDERVGFLVSSAGQLAERLEAYLAGREDVEDCYQGQVRRSKESISILSDDDELKETLVERWIAQKKLSKLLDLWTKGLDLDWNRLYGEVKPRRIALPGYPFAKERYWIDTAIEAAAGETPSAPATANIHPLLHANTSDLKEHRYSSTFTGDECFLTGDPVQNVLLGVACLEMARAAVERALPARPESAVLELRDTVWTEPIVVTAGVPISIALSESDQDEIAFEIYSEASIHCHGRAVWTPPPVRERLDVEQLRKSVDGENQLLAELRLPAGVETDAYVLHPSLMDGALQAAIRLAGHSGPTVLAGLDTLRILSACTGEMLAWARHAPHAQRFDVDVIDGDGNVCVQLEGLEFSQADVAATRHGQSYLCKWEPQPDLQEQQPVDHETVVIVCCGPFHELETAIIENYDRQNRKTLLIRLAGASEQISVTEWACGIADPDRFQTCLQAAGRIDAVYFLAAGEQAAESREADEIQFLRLVRCLQQRQSGGAKIDFYLLTLNVHSLDQRGNRFLSAGLIGLGYSLAQGNSRYRVRSLDLSIEDLQSPQGRKDAVAAIVAEPPSSRGEVCKLKSGRRHRQTFFSVKWDAASPPAIRRKGTYVIVGGAGTVGRVITRNLIEKYDAKVVWIGRSAASSETVQRSLKSCERPGANGPLYIQADVTDLDAMENAVRLIKEQGLGIDGAIFAAMALGSDHSLEQIIDDEFRRLFEIKAQGSRVFHAALKNEPMDFLCYFSSRQAFALMGASKYPAYASGVTFSDAFVRSLQGTSTFPVGIINWGIWKSSINEATEGLTTDSLDALSDEEGFECFEQFVTELRRGRIHQSLCVGESRVLESLMNWDRDEVVIFTEPAAARTLLSEGDIVIPEDKIAKLRDARATNELERWFGQLLFCQVKSVMDAMVQQTPTSVSGLAKRCGIIDKYLPWWNESLNVLCQSKYFDLTDGILSEADGSDAEGIRDAWPSQKERYSRDPDVRALATLVSDCLERLPEILQGRVLATDVIFPNSSMEKVEGVYRNNALSDSFNEIAANAVTAYVKRRLQSDPNARMRILEIGAGTGGTSAAVFAKLRPFQASIDEYCYTDLSKAFFFHAEETYVPEYPYIRCRRLDIEQSIEEQGLEIGGFDLVLASNVLHATRNIRRTVRNAKALLRSGGFLILEEISSKELYAHLTFGLLDGWWLSEDSDLRIPNGPGLLPSTWQRVLEEEGFAPVQFPASEAHDLGFQIVLAQSDGVVRQKRAVAAAPQPSAVPPAAVKKTAPAASSSPGTQEHIRTGILECMSDVLRISAEEIEADIAFSDYGIDSILGGKFIEQVNSRLTVKLNTAVVFEHSSLARLSQHVLEAHRDQVEAGRRERNAGSIAVSAAVQKPASAPSRRRPASERAPRAKRIPEKAEARSSEIAVIGMSGMFPKAANVDEFWRNLVEGIDGVEELPSHYLDQKAAHSTKKQPGKTRCKWGGVLRDRDCFDPLFFNLSPKEAESMNPHQRLVLQESWKAIEDAGYNPRALSGTQTGIFIGAEPTGYMGETFTGYSDAIVASRLSYVLNLNGPAFVVNTGCSSSAVAIHQACESLRNRETDLALAGGVNACMSQTVQIGLDQIDMLSPSGRSRTFDGAADGTIMSEGVAVVVLKRLEDALRAGDLIYGVISASGINQDGASNGITAPNGAAQEQLITAVYRKFGIDPENISYVEAHGTGTRLGDPVEGNALVRAFRRFTAKSGYCAVGSAKSHIGHTGAAAGVAGLIKILLSLQHGRIPRPLHFQTLNPLIEFGGSPFYVGTEDSEWSSPDGSPRMAALNAFGHSGTNAHLVVREHLEPGEDPRAGRIQRSDDPVIIPLSAKTTEQLRQKAIDLLDFIRGRRSEAIDLRRLGYALQTGREAMDERLGFLVSSVEQLEQKLQSYVGGKQDIDGVRQGRAKRQKDAMPPLIADDRVQDANLLELWVRGGEVDWSRFYGDAKPRLMRLPVYPFARERYWAAAMRPADRSDPLAAFSADFASVEDVLDRLEQGFMGEADGARALRLLVS